MTGVPVPLAYHRLDAGRLYTRPFSRHPTDEPAGVLVLDEGQPHADMAAIRSRTGKVFRNLVEPNVSVIHLDEKLYGTLKPHVQTSQARRFEQNAVVQVAEGHVLSPVHQKSSADGMRL